MILNATQNLLDEYPQLAAAGLKVGDDFEVLAEALNRTNESSPQTLDGDGEPDPPLGGDRPVKPPIIP